MASVHSYLVNPVDESATFWVRPPEWKFLNPLCIWKRVDAKSGYFFIHWRHKIKPSSLSWIFKTVRAKKKKCLFKKYLDTCGRGDFCIRKEKVADLKISGYVPRQDQRASVKLIFKITFKFRTSSFLYLTVLPGKIHVVTLSIDTVGKSLTKLSMRYLFRWWISERPRETNIVALPGVNLKNLLDMLFTSVAIVLRL